MVEGFKSEFYTTSFQAKKEGRKQETKSQQSQQSSLQLPQPTLNQQIGIQQNERKPTLKNIHTETPISSEKPKKQMKSVLHQEVSELNPSGQMSMEQLIKVVLNFQEEVKRLKKDNDMLMVKLYLAEGIELRLMSQERDLNAFWNISQSQTNESQNQLQKQTELDNRLGKVEENCKLLRKSKAKLELYKWKSKPRKSKQIKENNSKQKRNVSAVGAYDIFIGSVRNSNRNKETIGQKNNKRRKRKKQE